MRCRTDRFGNITKKQENFFARMIGGCEEEEEERDFQAQHAFMSKTGVRVDKVERPRLFFFLTCGGCSARPCF